MEPSKAAALILRSVADGRTSGAYLVCGSLKDSCEELVGAVLAGLFPGAADQIASRTHPDVVRLVPQGKSRTIKVEEGQTVVDTGLYGIVRHPMYAVTVLLFLMIPLILGSWYALIAFAFYPAIIIVRLKDEEELLTKALPGYEEYKQKVKYRIIPFIW